MYVYIYIYIYIYWCVCVCVFYFTFLVNYTFITTAGFCTLGGSSGQCYGYERTIIFVTIPGRGQHGFKLICL